MTDAELLDLLHARTGIVCAVGAGGKKTTLYQLLRAHPGPAAFTTTVFTRTFPADLPAQMVIDQPGRIVAAVLVAAKHSLKIAYACPSDKPGRYAGLPPAQVAALHAETGCVLTLVKADGARMRLIKAPGDSEPCLVPGATTVLALVSAHTIGLPLSSQHAHRPERVAAVTGAQPDEVLTPLHVARLIASEDGLLRGVGSAHVIPIINMADNAHYRALAVEAARVALELSDRYDRVVVAAMRNENPIVEVVTRARA
ncbi:MAG: selenium cofactor biosynthesis protein YqeC [Gammaproteobacteria bacterium]